MQGAPASERGSVRDLYLRPSIGSSEVCKFGARLVKQVMKAEKAHLFVASVEPGRL